MRPWAFLPPGIAPLRLFLMRTLHEAMIEVLRGRGWLPLGEVADEIASRGLWRRPSDGAYPEARQIRRRAEQSHGQYQHLFEVGEGKIRLRE